MDRSSNLLLTVIAAIIFGTAAIVCLVWPNAIRNYAIKNTSRNLGNRGYPLAKWMEGRQYLWSIRLVGIIALCALVLVVLVLLNSEQR